MMLGLRNALARSLKRKATANSRGLFFLHLGKCGGTSVTAGLHQAICRDYAGYVNMPQMQKDLPNLLRDLPYATEYAYLMTSVALRTIESMRFGCRLIHGHIPFIDQAYAPYRGSYCFATILRSPQARLLSSYRYSCRLRSEDQSKNDEFLVKRFARYLESQQGRLDAHTFCYYYSGIIESFDFAFKVECAKRNIQKFDVVGFLDELEQFSEKIRGLGFRRPQFNHLNDTGSKFPESNDPLPKRLHDSRDVTGMLLNATQLDQKIYDFARSRI